MEPEMVVSELEHELKEVVTCLKNHDDALVDGICTGVVESTSNKELVESMMFHFRMISMWKPPPKKRHKFCGVFTQHHLCASPQIDIHDDIIINMIITIIFHMYPHAYHLHHRLCSLISCSNKHPGSWGADLEFGNMFPIYKAPYTLPETNIAPEN